MVIDLRRAVSWLLRPLGLNPGRARANARRSGERWQAARAEQRAYITARYGTAAEACLSAGAVKPGAPAARRRG